MNRNLSPADRKGQSPPRSDDGELSVLQRGSPMSETPYARIARATLRRIDVTEQRRNRYA